MENGEWLEVSTLICPHLFPSLSIKVLTPRGHGACDSENVDRVMVKL